MGRCFKSAVVHSPNYPFGLLIVHNQKLAALAAAWAGLAHAAIPELDRPDLEALEDPAHVGVVV